MVRRCRHICDGLSLEFKDKFIHLFSDKALQYDEGSRCSICETWVKQPTNSKLDAAFVLDPYKKPPSGANIATVIEPNGKQVMLWLVPKLVKNVRCKCCGTQCRGKTHRSIKNRLRNKIFNTFPRDKLPRAPRGISNKKEEPTIYNIDEDDINYEGQESVFDLRGTDL